MKRKGIAGKIILAAIALLALSIAIAPPVIKATRRMEAQRFVSRHGEELERRIFSEQEGIPANIGIIHFNDWTNAKGQVMTEFILSTWGNMYFGCYYSHDGVPLAFQNMDVELKPVESHWEWRELGDNRGMTELIEGNWYYFEASF